MRRKFICGNWKMYKTPAQAREFLHDFLPRIADARDVDVGFAVPFTTLAAAWEILKGTPVLLGGQNVHWEDEGAFTGEISAPMLQEAGCDFTLVGHSERRQYFGETDQTVSRRAAKALEHGLMPLICVGETLEERDRGEAFSVVERQIVEAFAPLGPEALERSALAYEPVWAIGTGRTASSAQAQEMHAHARAVAARLAGAERARGLRILYGGSVKPANAVELLGQPDVDGALVGGASLDAETFASLLRFRV